MFWNKLKLEGGWLSGAIYAVEGNKSEKLVTESELKIHREAVRESGFAMQTGLNLLDKKLNLILAHLKLEYIPEKSVTEPAKLQPKTDYKQWAGMLSEFSDAMALSSFGFDLGKIGKPKEKTKKTPPRKYVKSGKYSKKNDPRN